MKETTILANYKSKKVKISDGNGDEKFVKINMWDISGSDTYQSMVKTYYVGCHGIIFVFDLSNRQSFYNITKWVERINDIIDLTTTVKILIGNKSDRQHRVSNAEIHDLTVMHEMVYFETTNTTRISITNAFDHVVNEIVRRNCGNRHDSFVLRDDKERNSDVDKKSECCAIS
jgi:small GTP-binding protein